jgi:hypothetical protein
LLLPVEITGGTYVGCGGTKIKLPSLLKSRNFSHVDQIPDINRTLVDFDLCVMIHAKISHGMGEGGQTAQNQPNYRQSDSLAAMTAGGLAHGLIQFPAGCRPGAIKSLDSFWYYFPFAEIDPNS